MPTVSPHSPCLTALPPPPEEQRGDDVAAAEAGAGDGEVPAVDKQLAVTEGGEKLAAAEAMLKYHGVMRVESGDKYEAYISNNGQVNGQKVCLGSYVAEEHAARAYDLAALKYWGTGPDTKLNFAISDYEKEIESMKTMSEDEFMAYIMRAVVSQQKRRQNVVSPVERKGRHNLVGPHEATETFTLEPFQLKKRHQKLMSYDIAAINFR